jgi:hypothetical protein
MSDNGGVVMKSRTKSLRLDFGKVQAEIQPLNTATMKMEVVGKTPLIMHAWSVKALTMIRDKQTADPKEATKKKSRVPKVPFNEFTGSLYLLPGAKMPTKELAPWEAWPFKKDTFGIPASTFGHGARFVMSQIGMDKANRSSIMVIGDLLPLKFKRLVMREDMVRIGWPPVADIRYRGMFEEWSCEIEVQYDADFTTPVQLVNLFNRAGTYSGALEWRPSSPKKPGTFGMYFVRGEKE